MGKRVVLKETGETIKVPRNTPIKLKASLGIYEAAGKTPRLIEWARTQKMKNVVPRFVREPFLVDKLVKFLKMGLHYQVVCHQLFLSPGLFLKWLALGRDGFSKDYIQFYQRIMRAEATAEIQLLTRLRLHQKDDWRASAWELERRFPERWGKVIKADVNHRDAAKENREKVGNTVTNDETARDLARKMIDGREYGYEDVTEGEDES